MSSLVEMSVDICHSSLLMKSILTSLVRLSPAVGLKKRKKRAAGGQNIDMPGWPAVLHCAGLINTRNTTLLHLA